MKLRTILTLLVVAGLLVPAAGAATNIQTHSPGGTADAEGVAAQDAAQSDDGTNYTRLYFEDRYQHLELQPGESDSVNVTVENGEDESVDLSPHVFLSPRGERPIEKSWVSLDTDEATLDAGEERTFEVTVSVPEDAEINRYSGVIAFTDETVQYPGRPARPVHGVSLNVEVWQEPNVRILSDRYTYGQVQAGDSFTREIVVENTGDRAVPVSPQMETRDRRPRPYSDRNTLDRSWVTIDAPNEIAAGETATIEVTVSPPENADRGDYNAELDLGLKDPARPDEDSHWQRLSLRFQVWKQPEAPFETTFDVSDDTDAVTLELSADRHPRATTETEAATFDVTFVSPDGEEIDAERVQVTNRGSVNLGEDRRPTAADRTYATGGERKTFTYRVEDPAAGSWSVKIMPHNTMHFGYEITREESG